MADPLVVRLAQDFRAALIRREDEAILEMARRWLGVERALEGGITELAEKMVEMHEGERVSRSAVFRMERWKALQAQMLAEINRYETYAGLQIANNQEAEALMGMQDAAGVTAAAGEYYGVTTAFDMLPVEAVENITALARAGRPLAELLEAAYPLASEGIINLLIEGTALGYNPRKTARMIIRQGLSEGLNHILLVARDQQIRAYRLAALEQYRASGVVRGYRRLAAKNDRTCAACLALDGQEQETDEMLPLHPQDRCTVVPTLKSFKPITFETGEVWFKKQGPEIQKKILGEGRYKAWKEGKFEFGRLAKTGEHEVWGPTVQVTPLKELLKPKKKERVTLKGWKRRGHRGGMWTRKDANIFIEQLGTRGYKLHLGIRDPDPQTFATREEAILAGNKVVGERPDLLIKK